MRHVLHSYITHLFYQKGREHPELQLPGRLPEETIKTLWLIYYAFIIRNKTLQKEVEAVIPYEGLL